MKLSRKKVTTFTKQIHDSPTKVPALSIFKTIVLTFDSINQ